MKIHRWMAAYMLGLFVFGCAGRMPVYDEAGKAISEREIEAVRTNKNFAFYAAAGGALSFGLSFFAGTLITRAVDKSQNSPELWATTGVGTVLGTVLFAQHGKSRDRSNAIEVVKEKRKDKAAQQLTVEKARQDQVEHKLKDLKSLRAKQEAEKARLEEELKKKKGKKGKN